MGFVRRHPVFTGLGVLVVAAAAVLCVTGVAVWQAAHNDEASRVDNADLIVVLGAAQYGGRPSPVFERRLEHAALLYERDFADLVLVVGGGQPGDASTEADAGRSWLVHQGLSDDDVFAAPEGSTTFESLEAAARFMSDNHLHSAFLVSDPWHNLRIRRMARDLGIDAYVSATGRSAASTEWTRFGGYSRETLAYLYYRVFGR